MINRFHKIKINDFFNDLNASTERCNKISIVKKLTVSVFDPYKLKKALFSILIFFFIPSLSMAQPAIPELWGMRVHDEAKVLSAGYISQLENQLKVFEDSTSNQVAVLLIKTLDGYSLESYSLQVAEKWKLGTEKNDNGILLLVVIQDRKMRIEVGQGLEGVLTDVSANRIIRNEIAPQFRRQDYEQGIQAGVNAIISVSKNQYHSEREINNDDFENLSLDDKLFIYTFLIFIIGFFTLFCILLSGNEGWILFGLLIPFYAFIPNLFISRDASILLFATFFTVVPVLRIVLPKSIFYKKLKAKINKGFTLGSKLDKSTMVGRWVFKIRQNSSSSNDYYSSKSSSGSNFSGGGGSFGGGGSSGSW